MGGAKEAGTKISNFINAKKRVLEMFGVREDYFVRSLLDKSWEIAVSDEDFYVLKYGEHGGVMQSSVIVKKENNPMIFVRGGYTMIVALDCVKVCFVLDNLRRIGKMPGKN